MTERLSHRVSTRRRVIAAAGCFLAAPSIVRAQGTRGVAFVIGNSRYQWEAQLPNVRRDVVDVAKRFESLGLRTQLIEDAGRDAMRAAFDQLATAVRGANFAAFYYAGHGAAWGGRSYFVPVDADLGTPSVTSTLPPLNAASMKEAAHKLWVYDNCRNSPADGWRQTAEERGAVAASNSRGPRVPNGLVLYSTAPGRVALDGPPGQNSPFAAAFLREFRDASVDLQSISSRLRRDLLTATACRQVLWDANGYDQPFAIDGKPRSTGAATAGIDPSRLLELTNAYAYARENGLPLPSGLVAYRPGTSSPASWKVGAFRFESKSAIGPLPRLLVVMSVEGGSSAEVIFSTKGVVDKSGKIQQGSLWRFINATISGNRLEFAPRVDEEKFTFEWRDANSGSVTLFNESAGGKAALPVSMPLSRLDG
jgi:hypothetical protein